MISIDAYTDCNKAGAQNDLQNQLLRQIRHDFNGDGFRIADIKTRIMCGHIMFFGALIGAGIIHPSISFCCA